MGSREETLGHLLNRQFQNMHRSNHYTIAHRACFGGTKLGFSTGSTVVPPAVIGALAKLLPREAVAWNLAKLQGRFNRCLILLPSVHSQYYYLETMFWWNKIILQHRFNRCTLGASIGAMMHGYALCQGSNGYYLDAERPVEPMPTTG
jgi:hypothetical protein